MTELVWWPMRGYGKHEIDPEAKIDIYNASYFENFERISDCTRGRALNVARAEFVRRHWKGDIIDIGIGSGAFIDQWRTYDGSDACGFDVATPAIDYLTKRGRYVDPAMVVQKDDFALTLWDSIEHMEDPRETLKLDYEWIFLSTPIYEGAEHCVKSRHYKPGEHIWYFTERGLLGYMFDQGYEVIERSRFEERFGRNDIGSYAFRDRFADA